MFIEIGIALALVATVAVAVWRFSKRKIMITRTNITSPQPELLYQNDNTSASPSVVKGLGGCLLFWVQVENGTLTDFYIKMFNTNFGVVTGSTEPTAIVLAPARQIVVQKFVTGGNIGVNYGGVGGSAGLIITCTDSPGTAGVNGPPGIPIVIKGSKDGQVPDLVLTGKVKVTIARQ